MSLKERLRKALPFSQSELEFIIRTAPFRYKEYQIPKRQAGKLRTIAQPTPEVKLIQRWLVSDELNDLPIHTAAKAYRPHVGLLENVLPHRNNRFLLKIDFSNFFPSITAVHLAIFLERYYPKEEIAILCRILCKFDRGTRTLRLAIGAPSSPALSNMLLYEFDCAVSEKCEGLAVSYTRYADDLSFSTGRPNILKSLEELVPGLIRTTCVADIKVNREKTVHASPKRGRKVTGLVITSENEVSIGRDRKRLLRSQLDHYQKGRLAIERLEELRGYLAFLHSVEPQHLQRLRQKFGDELFNSLLEQRKDGVPLKKA